MRPTSGMIVIGVNCPGSSCDVEGLHRHGCSASEDDLDNVRYCDAVNARVERSLEIARARDMAEPTRFLEPTFGVPKMSLSEAPLEAVFELAI